MLNTIEIKESIKNKPKQIIEPVQITRFSSSTIENVIKRISQHITDYQIDPGLLSKFSKSAEDQTFLSYLNGHGGYYIKFLSLLVKELGLKNIVELGNREGLSTIGIYTSLSAESRFTTIDIVKDQRFCPDQMFNDKRVNFVHGDVCDLSIFPEVPMDIDLLFSDTLHNFTQIQDEFKIYQHLLADRALVAIDDINLNDKRKFFDELPYPKWDLTELCHVSGWGLFLFSRKEQIDVKTRLLAAYQAAQVIWRRKTNESSTILEKMKNNKLSSKIKSLLKKNKSLHSLSIIIRKMLRLI